MGKYLHQITELSETPANGDLILIQDVSDTTDSSSGTTKRITYSNLTSGLGGGGGGLSNVVEDTTPQLGGDLDVNGNSIVSTSGANITIAPNGTGNVILGTMTFNADQSIGSGQDNYVLTYDHSAGTIGLEAASGGGGIALTDLSVGSEAAASGDGAISYNNSTGVFTYTPPTAAGISAITASSTDTLTNKTFDANGTGNSLSNVETADLASTAKTGADTKVVTGTEGTNGNLIQWNTDGDAVDASLAVADVVTGSSTDTFTNKTFDANGTGNSLSNVETADIASGSKSGSDTTLVTGTAGTNGNLVSWNADGDAVDSSIVASNVALTDGDTYTGTHDFGGATLEIPNAAAPSLSVAGQIALDTTTTDHTALLKYHDGTNEFVIPAILSSGLSTTDNDVIAYNAANNRFEMEAQSGSGGGISNVVEDTTPQLGGQLDVNGNAIGDGTRELLTFTEDGSAVNHINIENQATGSGPIISAAGDDTNIDLNLTGKGTGAIVINGNIDLSSGGRDILMPDNAGAALEIKEGGNPYLRFVTTNGSEEIQVYKDMNCTGASFSSPVTTSNTVTVKGTSSLGTFTVYGHDAADETCVIRAAASQTADIFQIQNSGGTELVTVDDEGNVGINAPSPSRVLHVNDTGVTYIHITESSLGTTTGDGFDVMIDSGANAYLWNREAGTLQFGTSNSEQARITSDGKFGINTASPNAKLTVDGSMSLPIESISATDTLDDTNHTVLVNASGGSRTVNLPAASGSTGKIFIIKKTDSSSNNVVIDPNASETIDGSSTFTFNAQYRAVTIQCDGSNWHIISSYIVNY